MKKILLLSFAFALIFSTSFAKDRITNDIIYQKLLDIEKRQTILETKFEEFKYSTERRFELIDKRFEELREDINKRFELIDKRFEDINKRFEDINKRFEQLFTFLWIITGIFTTIMVATLGFAYWDRRTIIRKAKEETIEHLEERGSIKKLIEVLREKAKTDPELAKILKQFNLL